MQEIRCTHCEKMLARIQGNTTIIPNKIIDTIEEVKGIDKDTALLEIKCPRCKTLNEVIV